MYFKTKQCGFVLLLLRCEADPSVTSGTDRISAASAVPPSCVGGSVGGPAGPAGSVATAAAAPGSTSSVIVVSSIIVVSAIVTPIVVVAPAAVVSAVPIIAVAAVAVGSGVAALVAVLTVSVLAVTTIAVPRTTRQYVVQANQPGVHVSLCESIKNVFKKEWHF